MVANEWDKRLSVTATRKAMGGRHAIIGRSSDRLTNGTSRLVQALQGVTMHVTRHLLVGVLVGSFASTKIWSIGTSSCAGQDDALSEHLRLCFVGQGCAFHPLVVVGLFRFWA